MSGRQWGIMSLSLLAVLLLVLGGLTVIVDPFFHYHAPLKGLAYRLHNERYQNNGILRHFDYDAVIAGTSMAQNFKTSELDALFGTTSVKVALSGAKYKEIDENLSAMRPDVRYVFRCLDSNVLLMDKDSRTRPYDALPNYLYDDNLCNDVSYIFNKTVLLSNTVGALAYTKNGGATTSFDDYSNWMEGCVFGKEAVDQTYSRAPDRAEAAAYTDADELMLRENIAQNVTALIEAHPNTTFYLFFPPYSIYYWDSLRQAGTLERQLTAEKRAIELLLPYENVRLFSFLDEFDLAVNLDKFKDIGHYSEDINSQMLEWMASGEHQLTLENYGAYCERVWNFYTAYDYDALFAAGK